MGVALQLEVAEEEWYELRRCVGSCEAMTGQQWAVLRAQLDRTLEEQS